ncbi:MAG TPA: hypothetical protein PK447_09455 [Ignavibacteria bacterium]|nr:hypothetical protein [Ignavibacteria bacterium]
MDEEKLYNLYHWKPEMGDYRAYKDIRKERSLKHFVISDTKKTIFVVCAAAILFLVSFLFLK